MTVPDRSEHVTVTDDVSLHVLRWQGGDRTPFVLVHGLASNARLWDGVADELARAGHPVAAVDLRGHGRSSKPDAGYDVPTVSDDLRAVVESSGFDRPVLVGQSWGGNVVIELAARYPGTSRAVACVDGGAIDLARDFPDWEACAEELRPPPLAGTPLADIESMLRGTHPDWPESGIAGTLASFEVRADGTVAPWLTLDRHLLVLRGLWEHRPSERFPLVEEEVLFITAAESTSPGELRPVAGTEGLQAVRFASIAGDHDLHAQHPVRVASLLRTLADRPTH